MKRIVLIWMAAFLMGGMAMKVGVTLGWESGDRFGTGVADQYLPLPALKPHADSDENEVYSAAVFTLKNRILCPVLRRLRNTPINSTTCRATTIPRKRSATGVVPSCAANGTIPLTSSPSITLLNCSSNIFS